MTAPPSSRPQHSDDRAPDDRALEAAASEAAASEAAASGPPGGDGATAPIDAGACPVAEPMDLPASMHRLADEVPAELEGAPRIRWIAERVGDLPAADREAAAARFADLAARMIDLNASDLDVGGPAAAERVWYRVDGRKEIHPEMGALPLALADVLLLTLLARHQREELVERFSVDFGYTLPADDAPGARATPRRYRTTVYFDNQHLALSMRMLAWKPRPLRSLGFHPVIERGFLFRYVRDGLTLLTGVTGSGKSTTLDAIVDANNEDTEAHILIVAQPIEYIHASKKCIIRHREVGADVGSFLDGMVQGLRQDPDIVVVGEMRDPETISTAMEMADTGHKVFSTLHTGSAIETIDRIVAEYPSVEQDRVRYRLGDVLRCVVSQKLLPAVNGGRVLAKEVLWMTPSSRAAIRNGNTGEIYQMIWQGTDQGMLTLEQDLARLVRTGDVTVDTAMSYANNKRRLMQLLK
jgi:twitching motility protein PilT